jgi:hypothetical protein
MCVTCPCNLAKTVLVVLQEASAAEVAALTARLEAADDLLTKAIAAGEAQVSRVSQLWGMG